jgi:hypothetical protein
MLSPRRRPITGLAPELGPAPPRRPARPPPSSFTSTIETAGEDRTSAYTALVRDGSPEPSALAMAPPDRSRAPAVETGGAEQLRTLDATLDAFAGTDAGEGAPRESGARAALRADGEVAAGAVDAVTGEGAGEAQPVPRGGEQRTTRRSRRQSQGPNDEQETRREFRAEPTPLPHTGGPGLPQSRLRIEVRAPPYRAVSELPPPAVQAGAETASPSGPDPQAARTVYAEAIQVARSYYDELVGGAVRIADAAEREARHAHAQLDADLSLALQTLRGSLSSHLAANDQARDTALARLESLAANLRRRIRLGARSAYGRLGAMKAKYDSETSEPRSKRATLPGRVQDTLTQNFLALWDAEEALDDFAASPGDYLSDGDFTAAGHGRWVAKAMREAMIEFIGPYATADKEALDTRQDAIDESLSPLADCLPCQLDTAFQGLDARMDYFMIVGPRSVVNALNGATARVDDLVEQMRISVEEAHASTARNLVEQHDGTRETLIQMAKMEQSGIAAQTEAGAGQLVGLLTSIAGSQTRGLDETHAELSKAAGQPAAVYATSVMSGSARLKSNIRGQAKAYPGPQLAKAAQAASLRGIQHRAAGRQRETALSDFDRALGDSIRKTYGQLDSSTEREFQRMANVPGQVRSTCDQALNQAEEARATDVANLTRAVNDLEARVNAKIAGQPAPQPSGAEGHGTPTPTPTPTSTPAAMTTPGATATATGGTPTPGQTMPPPASCATCQQEPGTETGAPNPAGHASETGGTGEGGGAQTDAPSATGGPSANSYMSSTDFQTYANRVADDPTQAEGVAAFKARLNTTIPAELLRRANECHTALDHWRQPDTNKLMGALRGLTATSGHAVEESYSYGDLRSAILQKYTDAVHRTLASTDTIQFNYNAAINLLNGNAAGGALEELRASINYSNEDSRIIEVMQNLTQAQMAQIPAAELDKIAADLDGEMLERFNALRRGDGGMERAITLRDSINDANMHYGTERGRKLQEALATARNAGGVPIEGDPHRQMADIFHLEHPDAVSARANGLWRSTLENFADLRQVQYSLHYQTADTDPTHHAPELSDEQRRERYNQPFRYDRDFAEGRSTEDLENMMLQFAVADRYYGGAPQSSSAPRTPPPGYHGETSGIADRPGRLPPDMINWISQTIHHGPGSVEERGAHALVEYNRAEDRGSAERLDEALHIGSADATEGGGYAPRNTAATDATRAQVLTQVSRYRRELAGEEPLIGPEDPRAAQRALRDRFSVALHDQPAARGMALGIIQSEHGSPVAAMEYAIEHENKDMALRYLRRMDRREIDTMAAEYDAHHTPGLYQRLGLFQYHGMTGGTAFSGDDALELEVAIMGVPQNDRERGEVALRRMDQQIDHSTGAGQTVAADEFARLEANRDALREVMGVTASDIDEHGRVRLLDADGNAIHLGNFNDDGSFRATPGATIAGFERAVALGQITAQNFTRAVDEAANWITTALAVVAAVVITIATAGAASILLPMLLTAALGLAGVGITWALKGGRYSRDDLTRDLANVAVQTIVAGVGAAAGLYMRAGAMGGRAVGTMMGRLSMAEGKLAAHLGMEELAKLTLKQELMLGALNGVLGNVGGAMADPRAWREGRVGDEIWHGMARGAVSGMIASATMRPLSGLGQDASLATRIGARAMLTGVSNSATKAWDLAYDAHRGAYTGSLDDALGEIGTAGATGVLQGGFEAGGEHFGERSGLAERLQNNHVGENRETPGRGAGAAHPAAEAPPQVPASELPDTARRAPPPGMGIDENGALVPHALMHDDEVGPLRTSDREERGGGRSLPEPANDNPGGRPHQVTALSEFDMVTMPKVGEGAVFVHPDSKNLMAANDNFGRLINADPSREVAIHFNPVTGEYVVIQGGPNSVAIIKPGGELSGPGAAGRLVSAGGVPSPEGHWIVHSHFHPNRPGEAATALIRRLPSGFGGDFGVIHFESVGLGLGDRRSRIYFSHEGSVAYTDFGISPNHPEGRYWIDFPHPQTGERVRRHFDTPGEYASFVKQAQTNPESAIAPRGGGLHTADAQAPSGALRRGSAETELAPSDRRSIRDLAGEVESLGEHRRAVDVLRQGGASEATIEAARGWVGEAEASTHSMLEQMGLVGESQSMDRLHHIMNDTTMSAELRQAIGEAVVAATREHMIRSGQLEADEPLMLLFHGAPVGRARAMAEGGIDLARVGSGHDDDFGAGFYLTSGVANAERYAAKFGEERGAIFPFMMRRRDMGQVIDVRPGGTHRAAWEEFVTRNYHMFSEGLMTPGMAEAMLAGRAPGFAELDGYGNRGQVFEAFLAHLSVTTGEPALARPDLVLGELGGPFTTGVGHGDQQAARTGVVADVLNSQMGSRAVPAAEPQELAHPGALRHDDIEGTQQRAGAEPDAGAAPAVTAIEPATDPAAPTRHPEHEAAENAVVRAIARQPQDAAEFIGILGRLEGVNEALFGQLLLAATPQEQVAAMRGIADEMRRGGTRTAEQIDHTLRELGSMVGRMQDRFRVEIAHSRLLAAHAGEVAILPPLMRGLVEQSPLALHLMLNPQLTTGTGESLFTYYSRRAASRRPIPFTGAEFDRFVMSSIQRTRKDTVLAGHAATLEPFMASLGDFNAGLEVGVPLARQVAGEDLDLEPAGARTLPKEVLDGLEPVPPGVRLEPGTRVEVPPYGLGTFMSDQDGLMWIHLDVDSAHGELTGIPLDLAPLFLAPGEQAAPGGARVPVRSQGEQDTFQDRIDAIRAGHADKDVPAFDPQTPSGTVAIAHVGGEDFVGTNSTLAAALTTMSVSERNELLAILHQFGIDPAQPGQRHDFVDHAELASLVTARQRFGRGNMPDVVELFVDRAACPNCRANLHALASWLGVKEIRIYYRNQRTPPPPLIVKARQ